MTHPKVVPLAPSFDPDSNAANAPLKTAATKHEKNIVGDTGHTTKWNDVKVAMAVKEAEAAPVETLTTFEGSSGPEAFFGAFFGAVCEGDVE